MTFKPGDLIRCVRSPGGSTGLVEGVEYEVVEYDPDYYTAHGVRMEGVRMEGVPGFWLADRFELVEDVPSDSVSERTALLREAEALVMGSRNNQYGPPTQDFARTAAILNSLHFRKADGTELQPHDVAVIQIAVKLSRLKWSPEKRDSWVDIAGYAACGWECAEEAAHNG